MRTLVATTWRGLPPLVRVAVIAMGIVLVVVLLGTQHDQPQCVHHVIASDTGQVRTYYTPSNGGSCTP